MAALFTAVVKAPITGSILITEMTGSFEHLLPVIIVSMVAYLVSDLFKTRSIYDDLYQLTIIGPQKAQKNEPLEPSELKRRTKKTGGKTIIEEVVCSGSMLEGKMIKNIEWSEGCLIVSIHRGGEEIIPHGDTRIYSGDYLYILVDETKESEMKRILDHFCSENIGQF